MSPPIPVGLNAVPLSMNDSLVILIESHRGAVFQAGQSTGQ